MASLVQGPALLIAALGFMRVRWRGSPPPEVRVLAAWMNSWTAVGAVFKRMTAQGFNVELKEFPEAVASLPVRTPVVVVVAPHLERLPEILKAQEPT